MFGKNSCKISGTVKKDKIVTKLEVKLTDDIKKLKVLLV